MRIALTFIAVALVAALTAALIAPILVDWSHWRGYFEAELSRRAGVSVTIAGPIDLRLLPTPYLKFSEVKVAGDAKRGEPTLTCDRMRFELAIGGLIAGQWRFTDVRLDRPVARLDLAAAAPPQGWRAAFIEGAKRIALDRIVIYQGQATVARPGAAPLVISNVDVDASAGSLIGPFRGSGQFSTERGRIVRFQFLTASITNGALPVKAAIDAGSETARATFDGKLAWGPGNQFDVTYDGAATLAGNVRALEDVPPSPWKLAGVLHANASHAKIENLVGSIGPELRVLEATGKLEADLGATPALDLALELKQLNIDAFLRHDGEEAAPPSRLWSALYKLVGEYPWPGGAPLAMRLSFMAPSAFLGARTLEAMTLTASAKRGGALAIDWATKLPGQSHAHFVGGLELGAAADFHGHVEAGIGDFRELREWLARDQSKWGARLAAFGDAFSYAAVAMKGDMEISTVGFSARNLELTLDRSRFTGAMAFTTALAGARARLFLDLACDGLDVDSAPDLSNGAEWLGDLDLSLALQASKLRVARVGQASVDGGSLDLKVTRTGDKLSLDRMVLANLGGATINAEGEAGPGGRWAKVRLDAARLGEFAALVARVAPGKISRGFVDRAELLSPAKATFEARRDGPPLEGVFPLDFVKADGEAGRDRFSLKLSRAPAPVDALAADLTLDSPDGATLLRQIGVKVSAGAGGRAHVGASASGKWETGFDAAMTASLTGTELGWRGRIVPADSSVFGPATLKSDNILNILAILGFAAPNPGVAAPVEIAADFLARGADVKLSHVTGTVAGSKVVANLAWKTPAQAADVASLDPDVALAKMIAGDGPAPVPARLTGDMSLDRANLGALFALPLGVPQAAKSGARWSDASFAPALLTLPATDISLKIGALDFIDGLPARDVSARLRMDPAKFELDEIAMVVSGGRAGGRLTLRRDGADAAATGRVVLESIGVDRPALRARLAGTLDFASTGANPAALMAGLAGQGQWQLAGTTIPRMDPGALARVLLKADGPDARIDATNIAHALNSELDRQPLAIPDGPTPVLLNSGVLRVGPIDMPEPTGRAIVSAEFDARAFSFGVHTVFEEVRADKFWTGSPPSVAVSARGTLDGLARSIDAELLAAGLAAAAIARESDRIAGLESDMRERAFFNRQIKAEHFLARREAEIAAYEQEQARLKSEADRRRVQDALARAREEQLKYDSATSAAQPRPMTASPARPEPKPAAPDPSPTGLY